MALTKNLPETLIAHFKTLPVTGHSTRQNFKANIDKIIELSIIQTKEFIEQSNEINDEKEFIQQVIDSNPALKQYKSAMPGNYSRLLNNYESMQSFRTIEAWADLREKARLLIFRLLTAIGISVIVLSTSFLAKLWDIPLSLKVGL